MKNDWRPVYGYEGLYEINSDGDVRNLRYTNKDGTYYVLKPRVGDTGYAMVSLTKPGNKTSKNKKLHRLLMLSFVGPDPDRPVVNHKGGNKLNNDLSNLEWTTSSENNIHAIQTGLRSYDKIRREYHVVVDDLDFTALGAKAAAKILHKHGYFPKISNNALRAGLTHCALKHQLYCGRVKVEATDDPYDTPKEYHRCGLKGRKVKAEFNLSTGPFMLKANGPANMVDKLVELNVWPDVGNRKTRVKLVSDAALNRRVCFGVRMEYIDN